MVPVEITIAIPGPLSDRPIDELATRARLLLVIDEVRAGRLTRAGAARALEMSLDAFLVEAGRHGLEAIDYDIEDFKHELGTIKKPTR
jgi:predicted HTH domain antitoxin